MSVEQMALVVFLPSGAVFVVGEVDFEVGLRSSVDKEDFFVGSVGFISEKPNSLVFACLGAVFFVGLKDNQVGLVLGVDYKDFDIGRICVVGGKDFLTKGRNGDKEEKYGKQTFHNHDCSYCCA